MGRGRPAALQDSLQSRRSPCVCPTSPRCRRPHLVIAPTVADQADVTLDGCHRGTRGRTRLRPGPRSPCRSRTQRHRSLRPARRRPGRATNHRNHRHQRDPRWTGLRAYRSADHRRAARTATAAEATSITPTGAGLVELVPPYGSPTIHTAETSRAGSPSSRHTAGPASVVQASGRTSPQAREPPQLGPTLLSSPSELHLGQPWNRTDAGADPARLKKENGCLRREGHDRAVLLAALAFVVAACGGGGGGGGGEGGQAAEVSSGTGEIKIWGHQGEEAEASPCRRPFPPSTPPRARSRPRCS